MENLVYIILAAVAGFLGFKFLKPKVDSDTEDEIEHKVEDARLKEKQKSREQRLLELQKKMEEARKSGKNLSDKDVENFWNND